MTTTTLGQASPWLFLRRFLRNPRHVGAVCPSTRYLGRAMLRGLELGSGDPLVEYGPGTGSFTQEIAQLLRRNPGLRYLGIERDRDFFAALQRRFPDLDFAHGQVEDVAQMLAERGLPGPRAIVSGLPLIFLESMTEIVDTAYQVLQPGGRFRTFSYLQSRLTPGAFRLRRQLRERFDAYRCSPLVLRNFPPAWVLEGRREGATAEPG